jgi:DNA-binding transcriptional regulator YiaG
MAVKPLGKSNRRVQTNRKKSGRVLVAVTSDSATDVVKVISVGVLRKRLKLKQPEFARLLPISQRSLATLESGTPPTPVIARRLTELKRLIDALSEIVDEDSLGAWLQQPTDAFDGLKPIEVIDRGQSDRLWEMIFNLRSGNPF